MSSLCKLTLPPSEGVAICTWDKIVYFFGIHFYLFLREVSFLDLVVSRSNLYQFVHVRVYSLFSCQNLFPVSQVKCVVTVYFVSSFIACDTSDVTASLFFSELWCSFWHFNWGVVNRGHSLLQWQRVLLSYVSFCSHKQANRACGINFGKLFLSFMEVKFNFLVLLH